MSDILALKDAWRPDGSHDEVPVEDMTYDWLTRLTFIDHDGSLVVIESAEETEPGLMTCRWCGVNKLTIEDRYLCKECRVSRR